MQHTVSFIPEENRVPALWLEAALAEREVSASSLARKIGVEVNTVSRWRRGASPISRAMWVAILGALALPGDFQPKPGFKPKPPSTGRPRTKAKAKTKKAQ